jgi:hypothetical protein
MNQDLCGARWSARETEAAQDAFAAEGLPTYRPDLIGFRDGETACLWDAEVELFGKMLPSWIQTIGTCVGMGMGRAMQDTIWNAIVYGDQFGYPVEVAWEPTYAVARTARDIGNGQMGSDPSGNYPAWFARAFRFYGVAIRKRYGATEIDLTRQREDLASRWCVRGSSCPQSIIDETKDFLAAACYWPQSTDEVLGCLRSRRGLSRAADRCTNPKRDRNGYSGLIPCGGHDQCWRGVVVDKHGEPFVVEQQSWPGDQAPHGEYELEDITGQPIELPQGAGLISMDDVKYCIKQGEVIATECPETLWREKP